MPPDQLCTCDHRESQHAEATLFDPHRPCKAKWWVDGKADCACVKFTPAKTEGGAA